MFSEGIPQLMESDLEQTVRKLKKKKTISVFYTHLLKTIPSDMSKVWEFWRTDVPELVEANWEEIWRTPFQILVSIRDRLIQFFF